jgi:hypothetical protein
MPLGLTFDVTTAVATGERLTQAAWAFLPDRPSEAAAVLVCLAGGTYDKHYWHLDTAGYPGYSFGEHLADAGYIVIAVDHLGIGESTDPAESGLLGLELLATGDAEVARQIRAKCSDGSMADGLPPVELPVIGVGHSMGRSSWASGRPSMCRRTRTPNRPTIPAPPTSRSTWFQSPDTATTSAVSALRCGTASRRGYRQSAEASADHRMTVDCHKWPDFKSITK